MAFNDGVKAAPIAYIGLVSVIVTFIIVLLLQVVFFGEQEDMLAVDQATQGPPAELADLTAKQLTQLTKREMVDRARGVVTIGISRAMELVVKELAAGKTPAEVRGPQLPAASPAGGHQRPGCQREPGHWRNQGAHQRTTAGRQSHNQARHQLRRRKMQRSLEILKPPCGSHCWSKQTDRHRSRCCVERCCGDGLRLLSRPVRWELRTLSARSAAERLVGGRRHRTFE